MLELPAFGAIGRPKADAAGSPAEAGTIIAAKLAAASINATRDIKLLLRHESQSPQHSVAGKFLKLCFIKESSQFELVQKNRPKAGILRPRLFAAHCRHPQNCKHSRRSTQFILII